MTLPSEPFLLLPRWIGGLALALVSLSCLKAGPLAVGDPMPVIAGVDQHDQPCAIEPETAHVLVSFEMGSGKQANAWLEKQGAGFLSENQAVFIANIHGMPGIGRMFALPKMRKYPHRILLADQEGLLDPIPEEKGKITVLTLTRDGRIAEIRFWTPKDGDPPFQGLTGPSPQAGD